MTTRAGRQHPSCFLCCQPMQGRVTTEHFVPRCFYESKRLPNEPGLTLPAHQECNRSTSGEEEWVFTHLALSDPLGGGPWGEREERAARSLKMPRPGNPQGLMTRFTTGAFALPGGFLAAYMGGDRLTWVVAKIAKGLICREFGELLPNGTEWTARVGDYAEILAMDTARVVEVPATGEGRGTVLIAKGLREPGFFVWLLILLGKHPVVVTNKPRDVSSRILSKWEPTEHDFLRLVWPKPRPDPSRVPAGQ